jgi:excisionase family DNA binding protein
LGLVLSAVRADTWPIASDMTTPQVAAVLGVAEATIRSWTDTGELPHWRTPGGHRRFAEDDVLALRDRRKAGERRQATLRTTTWQRAALVILHAAISDIGSSNELAQPFVRAAKEVRGAGKLGHRSRLPPAVLPTGEAGPTRGT